MAFADQSMEAISYYAILASTDLARERGAVSELRRLEWDRGSCPIDTLELLEAGAGRACGGRPRGGRLDWEPVRDAVRRYGMRNSNVLAIAPTATISNILGVSQSIEPAYRPSTSRATSPAISPWSTPTWCEELEARGLWDEEMLEALKSSTTAPGGHRADPARDEGAFPDRLRD